MTILTNAQAMADAAAAGFTGVSQQIIVAIANAESGLSTTATNTTGNSAGIDRGILQINSAYHPEVSNACAFDPVCAFKSAFSISKNGTDFSQWTTYSTGAYKQYLPASSTTKQWWNFPIISTFGQQDSEGAYYQPDANLGVPQGYPVLAGINGVVTSVQNTSWGQNVVTIRLSNPLNSEATHIFFEHLGSTNVSVGQSVNPNTLLGTTGGPGNGVASLGVGLYSGDVYGSGPGWAQLQSDLAPGGPGLLNPTNLINSLNAGTSPSTSSSTATTAYTSSSGIPGIDMGSILSSIFGSDAVQRGVIISVGLIIVLIGVIILFFSNPKGQQIAETAAMA